MTSEHEYSERRLRKRTWQDNVKTVELFHLQRILENGRGWSARKTALILRRSIGFVSENLRLSLALRIYPEVMEFRTRAEALEYLNRKNKCQSYSCSKWEMFQIEEIMKTLREQLQ